MSQQTDYNKFQILGVQIDALTTRQAIGYIAERAENRAHPCFYVTKPYVEFFDRADPHETRQLLNGSQLCLSDGVALNWASYYLYGGRPGLGRLVKTLLQVLASPKKVFSLIPERIGGINFTWPLLEACRDRQLAVFLVGTPKYQTMEYLVDVLRHKIPGLNIAGTFPGDLTRRDELLALLQASQPDVVLVGMGFPKQERLMSWLATRLSHGVLIGEGGSFDYRQFGGRLPRSPRWMQALNLEWLWRLFLQPQRLVRQLAIPKFIYRVYKQGQSGSF